MPAGVTTTLPLELITQRLRDRGVSDDLVESITGELGRRREQAEKDLRFMQQQIVEVGALKRRLEKLRSALKPGFDVWSAQRARDADTATMRRAISKERARLAKLRREAARG